MGHAVSTFAALSSSDDENDSSSWRRTMVASQSSTSLRQRRQRATTLAVMIAVASSSKVSAGGPPCCFAAHPPPSSHSSARSTGSELFAAPAASIATIASIAAASVPPPGSRLYQWREWRRHLQLNQLDSNNGGRGASSPGGRPGSSNNERGWSLNKRHLPSHHSRSFTKLRYTSQTSCPSDVVELRRNLYSSDDDDDDDRIDDKLDLLESNPEDDQDDSQIVRNVRNDIREKKRRKARMLRFLDRRFLRLSKNVKHQEHRRNVDNHDDDDNDNAIIANNDFEQRKAAWAAKYTSLSTLRSTFGTNKNRFWGDFDPTTTRKLYHTLLPRALLALHELYRDMSEANVDARAKSIRRSSKLSSKSSHDGGSNDSNDGSRSEKVGSSTTAKSFPTSFQDYYDISNLRGMNDQLAELAPLAYQARLAAKKYARERSMLPGRIFSFLYDGFRQWKKYGKFDPRGMSWEQVWRKYEEQVLREAMEEMENMESAVEVLGELEKMEKSVGLDDDLEEGGAAEGVDVEGEVDNISSMVSSQRNLLDLVDLDDEELTARICLRILERSVVTNEAIDKLFLERLVTGQVDDDDAEEEDDEDSVDGLVGDSLFSSSSPSVAQDKRSRKEHQRRRINKRKRRIQADLRAIEKKFDEDIRELLRYGSSGSNGAKATSVRYGSVTTSSSHEDSKGGDAPVSSIESTASFARGGSSSGNDILGDLEGVNGESEIASVLLSMDFVETTTPDSSSGSATSRTMRRLAAHEVFALRILAHTKQRIASLQCSSPVDKNA